ncbi:hypothetical protein ABT261_38245, partial [Amycolatopsis sp. NPDC000740]
PLPPGTPASVVHDVQQAAASVFGQGVVDAMRPTLALPVAVIAVGAVSCLLVRRRATDQVREPADAGTSAAG